jgi:hypothetical protein
MQACAAGYEGLRKTTIALIKIGGVPGKSRTEHISHKNLESYWYT